MGVADWTLLISLSVLWGGSFLFNGIAVRALPPLTIVVLRVGIAALALILALRVLRQPLPMNRRHWRLFLVMGLLNNVLPFSLIVWGQSHIASGLAAILNATTPLFTVLVAHALTHDEKLSSPRLFGVVMGFIGVAVMIGPRAMTGNTIVGWAALAVMAAAFSYALAGVFGRRFARAGVPPLTAATGQLCAATLILAPLALYSDKPWTLAPPAGAVWLAITALALLSTALAYSLYFRLLARVGATNLLLVTFLIPVSATLFGAFFLDERLAASVFVGAALIASGLFLIDGRLLSRLRLRCDRLLMR
ncbi:MAG: DMT family transporter [Pseudomonadota bacterium]